MTLSQAQQLRYGRQAILPEVGVEGQNKLLQAKILVVGIGGLGCPASLYLAAAGIGTLGLIDPDLISESNLHRQILYTTQDVGKPKVEVAKERLSALNPDCDVQIYHSALTTENALSLFESFDLIIDGTDNFATRYLVNDACVLANRVNIYGSILRFEGQVSVFADKKGPCYRCLFPNPPDVGSIPNCAEAGVIGTLPGTIGVAQANEAIKWILGAGEPLVGKLMLYDALSAEWVRLSTDKNPQCLLCGEAPTITSLQSENVSCTTFAQEVEYLSAAEFKQCQHKEKRLVLDVRTESETALACIENAICLPLSQLEERISELAGLEYKNLVITCQKGPRAERAVLILQSYGFKKLTLLTGGMEAYLAA